MEPCKEERTPELKVAQEPGATVPKAGPPKLSRFHIERLEERIAPDKGGVPHHSSPGNCACVTPGG